VKFRDLNTGIHCDLNINDQLGFINTSLIRHYCDILPVLRPLLLAIKRWARPLGYNNPAGAPKMPVTFSSYTLAIMTIGLLQVPCSFPACFYISASPFANFSQRQGVCCRIYKKVPHSRKVGNSGCGREQKKGSTVMLDGRRHKTGRLLRRWGLNRLFRTGFSMAKSLLFTAINRSSD
jgi:hypothetical protein